MFPVIRHINDVLPHIQDAPEITVKEREGYTVINYQVFMKDTFPDDETLKSLMRRECRGLIFDTATGVLLRRPFHKFFNINERASTHQDTIDLREKHVIPEKLDGCLSSDTLVKVKNKKTNEIFIISMSELTSNYNEYEVMSYNEVKKSFEFCDVLDSLEKLGNKDWIALELEDGSIIKCTEDHKFLTENGWVKAKNLLNLNLIIND